MSIKDNYIKDDGKRNSSLGTKLGKAKEDSQPAKDLTPFEVFSNQPRPQFRIQIKKWLHSNFGDFIEFQMIVQSLEGHRPIWALNKRYTDFVKLHEKLMPFYMSAIGAQSPSFGS